MDKPTGETCGGKNSALLETRKSEGNSFWNDKKAIKSHFIRDLNEWRDTAETRIAGMGIQDGSRVLDIGAGTGILSVPLAAHGCEVTAVEPSPVMGEPFWIPAGREMPGDHSYPQTVGGCDPARTWRTVRYRHRFLQPHGYRYR